MPTENTTNATAAATPVEPLGAVLRKLLATGTWDITAFLTARKGDCYPHLAAQHRDFSAFTLHVQWRDGYVDATVSYKHADACSQVTARVGEAASAGPGMTASLAMLNPGWYSEVLAGLERLTRQQVEAAATAQMVLNELLSAEAGAVERAS